MHTRVLVQLLGGVGAVVVGLGCATTGGPKVPSEVAGACPGDVPGVATTLYETNHGVAVIYTTETADQVEVLRERVHALPGLIASRQGKMPNRETVRIQSSSDDVEGGAKLVVLPMLAEDRPKLQNYVHLHDDELRGQACPEEVLVR